VPAKRLRAVKLMHTVIWAFFASAILGIPVLAWRGHFVWVGAAVVVVLIEVAVLVLNNLRCPLTDVAAQLTDDRRANFDIYLPLWLAAWNKAIFGTLFVAGLSFALFRWLMR
jgi:hypothetical protein